jgi:dTDP-4-amino-4,6-dideoxygalactose transaminase
MKWKIALSDLDFDQRELKSVVSVIKGKWLSMGWMVKEFEDRFAQYIGTKYAIATSSGTAALHLALRALDIQGGDEVLVPSITFVASANAVLYTGAKPKFVDSTSLDDFNLSVEDLEKKITKKSKAIIVVHYAGYIADMEQIKRIAQKYNLSIIEDSAHAIGVSFGRKMAGNLGDIGCFSFFANKNMATGEGGMVTTNNEMVAQKIRLLRSHGMTSSTWEREKGRASSYDVVDLGYNYRMTEIAAALGLEQLKKLSKNNLIRKKLTGYYVAYLNSVKGIAIPFRDYPRDSSFHLFPILLDKTIDRKKVIQRLRNKEIQTSIHYPPVHRFSYYQKKYKSTALPDAEYIGSHELTLPLHPLLTRREIKYVCDEFKKSIKDLIN